MRNFFTDWLSRKHHYGRYRIVKGMVKDKGKNLLDIGCGRPSASMDDGSFLRYLGYGQGVDIRDMKVEFKFRKASILDLPFRNKSFDAVTAIEVIEHVDDPDLALRNVKRVLKKNATFVMTTPNNNLLFTVVWSIWQRFIGKEWRHAHVKILKKEEWLSLLEKHFRIVKVVDYWHVNLIIKMVNK